MDVCDNSFVLLCWHSTTDEWTWLMLGLSLLLLIVGVLIVLCHLLTDIQHLLTITRRLKMKDIVRASIQTFMAGVLSATIILSGILFLGKVYRESNSNYNLSRYQP
jgi:hypothetical protein